MTALVYGLLRRFRMSRLKRRYDPRLVLALCNLIIGGMSIGLLAAVAHLSRSPFVFPSLRW